MRPYRTWEDLREDGAVAASGNARTSASPPSPSARAAGDGNLDGSAAPATGGLRQELLARLPPGTELPADVLALVDDYERAEAHLRRLTGQAPAEPEDPRESARFPLKTHTAASRLEEKRLARLDEQSSAMRRQLLERRAVEGRRERERIATSLSRRERARRAAARARVEAERERERRAARTTLAMLEQRERVRWELVRHRALQRASLARRELAAHEQRQLDRVRGRCLEARRAARLEAERDEARRERAIARRRAAAGVHG